jgi:hypothetical protein
VTIPRNVKQSLPGPPDLEITLPISEEALLIGGHLNPFHGHCANHLIIGNLGDNEIVLVSCDDGDMVGYYTRTINDVVKAIQTEYNDAREDSGTERMGERAVQACQVKP